MKKNLTELVFILDRSGSMAGLENDTIGGFNSMLEKQKKVQGECFITTVLFDNRIKVLHDRTDIRAVRPMTRDDYRAGGSTALLDAMGMTINKIINAQRNTAEDYRAENVMFVIITDGEENSSREYSSSQIKQLVEDEKNKYGWEFVFLGANIDAVETAGRYGIRPEYACDYIADDEGTKLNYSVMSDAVTELRCTGEMPCASFSAIREDVKKRRFRRR